MEMEFAIPKCVLLLTDDLILNVKWLYFTSKN